MDQRKIFGKTLTLKIKFNDFNQITRSKTYNKSIVTEECLWEAVMEIWENSGWSGKSVRLLGLAVSNFKENNYTDAIQLTIEF